MCLIEDGETQIWFIESNQTLKAQIHLFQDNLAIVNMGEYSAHELFTDELQLRLSTQEK